MYHPRYAEKDIACGYGNTIVLTGWTKADQIVKLLNPEDYAAVGQLYSATRGINLLIRNILLNPYVTHIIGLNNTRADEVAQSIQCLQDFFNYGFRAGKSDAGRDAWIIESSVSGQIDFEVPSIELNRIRSEVKFCLATSRDQLISLVKSVETKGTYSPQKVYWSEPKNYQFKQFRPNKLPGQTYTQVVRGETVAEVWTSLLNRVVTNGNYEEEKGITELLNLVAVVENEPFDLYFPEPNYLPTTRRFVNEYIKGANHASSDSGNAYSYGNRIRVMFGHDQIDTVIKKLEQDIHSKQCVVSLWNAASDHELSTPPCLNHVWFKVVQGKLTMTATFRSHDIYGAWVDNAFCLRKLQFEVGRSLAIGCGPMTIISQSAHIYDNALEAANKTVKEHSKVRQDYSDPVGSFLIEVDMYLQRIIVSQTTPGSGEEIGSYEINFNKFSAANTLVQLIIKDNPSIELGHAAYLGVELQKAISLKSNYKQDN